MWTSIQRVCKSEPEVVILLQCSQTLTHTVHYLQPWLKRAQGGFVSLWKGPRKMFSDKLFTIPQSLLGRVLHRAAWRITHPPSLPLSPPVSPSSLLPIITHSLFQCALFPLCVFLSLSLSLCLSLFVFCDAGSHAPQRRAWFSGKLSLIMVAINNMS